MAEIKFTSKTIEGFAVLKEDDRFLYVQPVQPKDAEWEYKCGHRTDGVIISDNNPLSVSAYLEWSKTVGINGDRSECYECWCKRIR